MKLDRRFMAWVAHPHPSYGQVPLPPPPRANGYDCCCSVNRSYYANRKHTLIILLCSVFLISVYTWLATSPRQAINTSGEILRIRLREPGLLSLLVWDGFGSYNRNFNLLRIFLLITRRVATCKPGKPGLTSFTETLALFFIQFL